MKRKVSRIQVPNKILINRKLKHEAFGLYVTLKKMSYNNKANVGLLQLKEELRWKDNRTINKYLNILEREGLITKESGNVTVYKLINITITECENKESGFTQVDVDTLEKIREITKTKVDAIGKGNLTDLYMFALRLFYYYEKNYNVQYGMSFPSYEMIIKDTGISGAYIKSLNELFHDNGLVKVTKGGLYYSETKDGKTEIKKENNTYIPYCDRFVHD